MLSDNPSPRGGLFAGLFHSALSRTLAGRWRLPAGLFAIFLVFPYALAQQQGEPIPSRPTVTATASADGVRIASPGETTQMRLEVFDAEGVRLFDSGFLNGNLLDWPTQDQLGKRLADGSYLGVATTRDLGGRESRRAAVFIVASAQLKLEPLNVERLSVRQAQALEAGRKALGADGTGGAESLTVLAESEQEAMTLAAHDGREGRVVSTRGALTFGTGNILSGTNVERVRITEDGNVGVGTEKPEATLDVAGEVRARGGIKFLDGTTLDASGGKLTLKDAAGGAIPSPSAAGTGTQNRVAKWAETGGAGTLADSSITEVGGRVGINAPNPGGQLHIGGTATEDLVAGMGPDLAVGPAFNFGYAGATFGRGAAFFNVRPDEAAVAPNPSLRFFTSNVERMIITATGNVGIGTSNPLRPLQIGASPDAAFSFAPSSGTPNAGFVRFGDNTGWKLHFARNREQSGGLLNSGTTGVLMTVQDNGNVAIGTTNPQAKLDVRGNIKLGNNGEFFAPGGEENLRIVRGVIGFNGNIIVGSGFTATLTDVGKYTIAFNTPFAGAPAVTATTDFHEVFTSFAQTDGVTTSEAKIRIFARSSGNNANETFHFIAIGPR